MYDISIDSSPEYLAVEQDSDYCITRCPERQLWAAVLLQAVKDARELYQKSTEQPHVLKKTTFQHEVQLLADYFQSPSMQSGSLCFICSWLDIDPDEFSNRVMAKYLDPLLAQFNPNTVPFHTNLQ